jgi:endonuclease/exonuclease/phosphatase family metal-dependent hydrolase
MNFRIGIGFLVLLAGCSPRQKPDFAPANPHLKVVTYNVNWGFSGPQIVAEFLDRTDADIVCLQETHSRWEAVLKGRLGTRYPHCIFKDSQGAGGIAIMSRYPLSNTMVIEPDEGWFPAILTNAQTPLGQIRILNVHLRPPLSDEGTVTISGAYNAPGIHLKEIQGFIKKTDPNDSVVITGDFNENETDKAVRWLIGNGFTDTLSSFDTDTKTWVWRTSAGISLKARYDHILINRYLACTGATVVPVQASDHMPVVAVIVGQP